MSLLKSHITSLHHFLVDASSTRRMVQTDSPDTGMNGIDVAAWTISSVTPTAQLLAQTPFGTRKTHDTLMLAVNFNYPREPVSFRLVDVAGSIVSVLFGDVVEVDDRIEFRMRGMSIAAVIVSSSGVAEPTNRTFLRHSVLDMSDRSLGAS